MSLAKYKNKIHRLDDQFSLAWELKTHDHAWDDWDDSWDRGYYYDYEYYDDSEYVYDNSTGSYIKIPNWTYLSGDYYEYIITSTRSNCRKLDRVLRYNNIIDMFSVYDVERVRDLKIDIILGIENKNTIGNIFDIKSK